MPSSAFPCKDFPQPHRKIFINTVKKEESSVELYSFMWNTQNLTKRNVLLFLLNSNRYFLIKLTLHKLND